MDIRRRTVLIIRSQGQYLVGYVMGTMILRWSESPYDAWATRKWEDAERMARMVDGELMLFNPVAGQLRPAEVRR